MTDEAKREVAVQDMPTPLPLIALTPTEMVAAQTSMGEWCDRKIDQMADEIDLLREGHKLAKDRKWRVTGWATQIDLAEQRLRFYGKIKMAVENGYLVIPDFPIDVFAVRTVAEEAPVYTYNERPTMRKSWGHDAHPTLSEVGEGRYVAPVLKTHKDWRDEKDPRTGQSKTVEYFRTCAFNEAQFPVQLAQPKLVDAVKKAMALRVFDAVGMVGTPRRPDPIIVGKILDPREWVGYYRGLTFFIAWWFNWEML